MVKEFSVGFSRTINLGNFESARVEASVTHSVEEGAGLEHIVTIAQVQLRQLLEETYRAQMQGHKDERTAQRIKAGGPR